MPHPPRPTLFRVAVAVLSLAVVVGGVVVGVLAWRNTSHRDNTAPDPAAGLEAAAELGSQYAAASGNRRDLTPLIARTRELLRTYPDLAPLHTVLAQMLLDQGDWAGAQAHIEQSLQLDPHQTQLQAMAGSVALNLKRLDQAKAFYGNAAAFDPTDATFRVKLANAMIEAGDPQEAGRVLEEALRLDATMHQAEAALADLAMQRGDDAGRAEADDRLKRAADLAWKAGSGMAGTVKAKQAWTAYIRRRAAYASDAGRPNEAAIILYELQREPAALYDRDPAEQLAKAMVDAGDPIQAALLFQQVVRVHPEAAWAWADAARFSLDADLHEQARESIRRLRRIDLNHPDLPTLEHRLARSPPTPTTQPGVIGGG